MQNNQKDQQLRVHSKQLLPWQREQCWEKKSMNKNIPKTIYNEAIVMTRTATIATRTIAIRNKEEEKNHNGAIKNIAADTAEPKRQEQQYSYRNFHDEEKWSQPFQNKTMNENTITAEDGITETNGEESHKLQKIYI